MRIVESFSNWINSYDINENISAAKNYMQKRYAQKLRKDSTALTPEEIAKALQDPEYLKILELVKNHPGYANAFVKFRFDHGATIEQLASLLEVIKNKKYIIQQLPNNIDYYANAEALGNTKGFEQLTDEIRNIEIAKEAKWLIDRLPIRLRNEARALTGDDKNILINAALSLTRLDKANPVEPGKLSVVNRLLMYIIKYEEAGESIHEVLERIVKYIKGYDNLNLVTKVKEIEDLDPEAGILYSDDQYLVISVRTEKAQKALCGIAAKWCINSNSFNSYASKGLQVNIFNFGLDPTNPLFLTGNTIAFAGHVTDSSDINNITLKEYGASPSVPEHLTKLGYPQVLIKTVVRQLPTEFVVKRVVADLNLDKLSPDKILFNIIKQSYAIDPDASTESLDIVFDIIESRIKSKLSTEQSIELYAEYGILSLFSAKLFKVLLPDIDKESYNRVINSTLGLFAELNTINQTDPLTIAGAPNLANLLKQEPIILKELGLNHGDVEEVMESFDRTKAFKLIMEFMSAEPMVKPAVKPATPTTKPVQPRRPSPVPHKQPFKQPEPAKAEADDVIKRYTLLTNEKF